MAPQAGFDSEQVREKARKDLLYLLEGVRTGRLTSTICMDARQAHK
jgi:hypothetical protein